MGLTREEAKLKIKNGWSYRHDGAAYVNEERINAVIDQIFNGLEAQLKAKESDLERQDMIIKCLSMDLDNKEKLLKTKDEEIDRLKAESKQAYIEGSKACDDLLSLYIKKIV